MADTIETAGIKIPITGDDQTGKSVEKAIKNGNKTAENHPITIPTEVDLKPIEDAINDLQKLMTSMGKIMGAQGSKIEKSFGKIDFKNFAQSLSNIENILARFNKTLLSSKDNPDIVNIKGITTINKSLTTLSDTAISVKESMEGMDKALRDIATMQGIKANRSITQIEEDAKDARKQIDLLQQSLKETISSPRFQKRDISKTNLSDYFKYEEKKSEDGAIDIKEGIGYKIAKNLMTGKKVGEESLREFMGSLTRIYAEGEGEIDKYTIKIGNQVIQLREVIDKAFEVSNKTGKKIIPDDLKNIVEQTDNLKKFNRELEVTQQVGQNGINVSIDEESIKKLSDAIDSLNKSFSVEEGSTIGFKSEDIEKITQAFAELKSVVIEIKDLLKTFDIPKIKPDGDTAIRNWISDLERAGEVAKSTDKAIEEAFKVSKAQDAGSSVDLLKNSLEEQAIENSEVATRAWISLLEEAGEVAKSTDKAIEEAFKISHAQDAGNAVDFLINELKTAKREAEEFARDIDYAMKDFVGDMSWKIKNKDKSYLPEKKSDYDYGYFYTNEEYENRRAQDIVDNYTKIKALISEVSKRKPTLLSELEKEATELKAKLEPIDELVKQISEGSSIKDIKYDEISQAAGELRDKLATICDEGKQDTVEYIIVLEKLWKLLERKMAMAGGVKASGARDSGELHNWILRSWQEDTGKNFSNVVDALWGGGRYLSILEENSNSKLISMRELAGELLNYNMGGFGVSEDTKRLAEINSILSFIKQNMKELSDISGNLASTSAAATRQWISQLEETGEVAERTDKAIEEAFRVSNAQDAGSAVDLLASSLREAEEQAEKQAELMRTADFAFKKDTHQANEDSLIPRETVSVAREVNNTLEQTEDITKRIPGNVEETALALRETSQQARSAAEEIEQAFRTDIDQKSKDNMIQTETLPAVREINDAFEQTGEIGTTALVRIDSEAENTIGIFKRLADVVENIFRIASTSDNIIDLDESQYRFVDAEESQYRPTDTADSVRGLIEEKAKMDDVGASASKTAKKKREFAEANQSVLASIKESLKGLSDETEAFNALNSLIKTMGKNSEMDNTIKGLKAIENLLSSPLDDNSMVSAIKELAAQGDVLKDVANVLKNASKQKLANAKESLKGDTEKVDKKAQREKEKAEKEKLKAIEKAQTQEIKNQNKLYNESIRLLEQIDKLKLKNLSLSPTSDAYIKNEHDIRKKENQYNDNLDKLDLQKRADLTAELRQKNDQYNDSLAETARKMAEVNAQSLEKSLEKLNDAGIISFNDRIEKMITNLRSVDSAVSFNNLKSKLNELVGDINKKFDYIKKSAGKLFTDVDIGKWSDKLQKEILDSVKVMPKLKEEAQEVFDELQKLKESKIDLSTEEAQNHLKELKDSFDKVLGKKKLDEYKAASADTISKLNIKIDEFVKKNSAMGHDFQERFKNLKLKWDAATSIEEVKKLEVEFNKLKSEVYEADKTGASFFDTLRQRAMGVNAQLIAQYLSWQDMIRYARQAAEAVISVDSALTELRKVSGESTDRLQESFRVSTETAKELGSTISDVISVTADWSRVGYGISDAEELARITTLFQTVGDNMTAETASQAMISTIKAYGMQVDEVESIVDKYNEVARISWQNNIVIYYWVDNYIG